MRFEITVSKYKSKYQGILISSENKIIFYSNYHTNREDVFYDIIDELIRRQA